jgi:hypothetical protein
MAGFYEGTDLADKTLYGFRLDAATGNLNIEIIGPTDGDLVVLPQDGFIDSNDYKQALWTRDTLGFQWGNNGHLLVKIV